MRRLSTRILFISSSWPAGRTFGGQLRALHIGRALQQAGEVTLVVVGSDANDAVAAEQSAALFRTVPPICPQPAADRGWPAKLRRAWDTRYLNLHGVVAPPAERARLRALVAQHDLVWVLNARTPNILQQWFWPHAHLDLDDVPSTFARTTAADGATMGLRLKARVQLQLLKRRELLFRERFTTLSVCSELDRQYLGGGDQIHVIPNGFERPAGEPPRHPTTHPPRLGFIGLFTYAPNREGVEWFLQECWPAIRRQVPGIRFRLAGSGTDGMKETVDSGIEPLGWIADPVAEIATWSAMVVPIRFGGGTRIKLADAFSRKCPVVATPLGAYGYEVTDGLQLRIAQTPAAFAAACVELVRQPERAAAMAGRAWNDFLQKWTWEAIAPRVWRAVEECGRRAYGCRSTIC